MERLMVRREAGEHGEAAFALFSSNPDLDLPLRVRIKRDVGLRSVTRERPFLIPCPFRQHLCKTESQIETEKNRPTDRDREAMSSLK